MITFSTQALNFSYTLRPSSFTQIVPLTLQGCFDVGSIDVF